MSLRTPNPSHTSNGIPLSSQSFHTALELHLDATKPDELVKKQARALCFQWKENDNDSTSEDNEPNVKLYSDRTEGDPIRSLVKDIHHNIFNGTLRVSNKHVCLFLRISCSCCFQYDDPSRPETPRTQTDAVQNPSDCFLHRLISLHFKLESWATLQQKGIKISRAQENVVKRISTDQYIKKLLLAAPAKNPNKMKDKKHIHPPEIVCEAVIHLKKKAIRHNESSQCDDLDCDCKDETIQGRKYGEETVLSCEERVNVSDEVLEGIRRSVFSQMESNLSVLEMFLAFPWLPRETRDICSLSQEQLSDLHCACERARLRLLEDALFDACEHEEENEMIDELTLEGNSSEQEIAVDGKRRKR